MKLLVFGILGLLWSHNEFQMFKPQQGSAVFKEQAQDRDASQETEFRMV